MKLTNLKAIRKASKKTQAQVAKDLKVTSTTYYSWESGLYEPDIETIKKLADYFHVSTDYILDHEKKFFTDEEKADLEKAIAIIKNKLDQ